MWIRLVVVMILLAFTASGWGQAVVGPGQKPGGEQTTKHKTKVEAEYDSSKNLTELHTRPMVIWKPLPISGQLNFEVVEMAISFSYSGKKIVTPDSVTITLYSRNYSQGRFAKLRDLSFTADAQQFQFGEMELGESSSSYVPASAGGDYLLVTEKVRKLIPFASFVQISQSAKVKMKVSNSTFKLEKEHLEAFRNFVALMREEGLEF